MRHEDFFAAFNLTGHTALLIAVGLVILTVGLLVFILGPRSRWAGFAVIFFGGVLAALPVLDSASLSPRGFSIQTLQGAASDLAESVNENTKAIEAITTALATSRAFSSQSNSNTSLNSSLNSAAQSLKKSRSLSRSATQKLRKVTR